MIINKSNLFLVKLKSLKSFIKVPTVIVLDHMHYLLRKIKECFIQFFSGFNMHVMTGEDALALVELRGQLSAEAHLMSTTQHLSVVLFV